jgi:hypothetical protein
MKNLRPFLFLAVLTFEQSQALDEIFDKNVLKEYPVYEYDEGLVILPKEGRAPF